MTTAGENNSQDEEHAASEQSAETEQEERGGEETSQSDELAELLRELGLTPTQAAARLRNAPKWEQRARENYKGAQKAQTLSQQIDQLRSDIAQRDAAEMEKAAKLAMRQVKAELRANGVDPADVQDILSRVNATDLLADGDIDDGAVSALAGSLLRVAGRPQPDPDQGKRGDSGAETMDAFIRRMAGRGQRTFKG